MYLLGVVGIGPNWRAVLSRHNRRCSARKWRSGTLFKLRSGAFQFRVILSTVIKFSDLGKVHDILISQGYVPKIHKW